MIINLNIISVPYIMSNTTTIMTDFEKLIQRRELGKKHAKTYYLKNRDAILAKKKQYWEQLKASKPQIEPQIELQIEPKTENKKKPIKNKKPIFTVEYILDKLNQLEINPLTKKKYINDVNTLMKLTNCDDFVNCFKNHKNIINLIETGKQTKNPTQDYSLNTKKGLFQIIVWLIDNLQIPLTAFKIKIYKKKFEEYKIKSTDLTEEKTTNELDSVIPYKEYINKIKTKFGEDSKEFLLASLYNELTVRDDFYNLIIKQDNNNLSDDNNYIIVNDKKSKIILNQYKSREKYKTINHTVSSVLDKLIKNYIKNKNLKIDDTLFGKTPLTKIIGTMNRAIDIEGSINTLRHIKVSDELRGVKDVEKRQQLAAIMLHSPATQQKYIRKIEIIE